MPRAERRAIKAQVEALNRLIEEEHAKLQSATTAVTTATTTAARSRKSLQDLDGGTVWNRLRSLSEDGDELEGAARDEVEATDEQFAESGKQLGMLQNNPDLIEEAIVAKAATEQVEAKKAVVEAMPLGPEREAAEAALAVLEADATELAEKALLLEEAVEEHGGLEEDIAGGEASTDMVPGSYVEPVIAIVEEVAEAALKAEEAAATEKVPGRIENIAAMVNCADDAQPTSASVPTANEETQSKSTADVTGGLGGTREQMKTAEDESLEQTKDNDSSFSANEDLVTEMGPSNEPVTRKPRVSLAQFGLNEGPM